MPLPRCAAAALIVITVACASSAPRTTVPRDRAIAIARSQVKWEPFDTKASRATSNGRQVWRIILKGRLPGQPPLLFETAIVEVDAANGQIVSLSKT